MAHSHNQGSPNTTLVLLGRTGAGKSSVGNRLLGMNEDDPHGFPIGEGATIGTAEPICKSGYYLGDSSRPCRMVDTPGLDDEGDTTHITDMTIALYKLVEVHIFILVLNSEDPRISRSVNLMLKLYSAMLGVDFWKHVVILVSRWHFDEKSVKRKKKVTWQSHFEMYKQDLHNLYPASRTEELLFVYIDSTADFSDSTELKMFEEMATTLWKKACDTEPYICQNAREAQSEKDKMADELKRLEEMKTFFEESLNKMKENEEELERKMEKSDRKLTKMRNKMDNQQTEMQGREQAMRDKMDRKMEKLHIRNNEELKRKESEFNTVQEQLRNSMAMKQASEVAELTATNKVLELDLAKERKKWCRLQ